jgi:hypothetical protein
MVTYGEFESELKGTANFISAVGGNDVNTFFRRGDRERPVLIVLAGTHGAEVEGMVGALSLLSVMEKGTDLKGDEQPQIREVLDRLRLIVIPCANPDGRARVPYDGFVGLPTEEMSKVNQGTRTDGTLYGWPGCKKVHPMEGDVGFLGGYFDDAGINLMHDEWFNPMSPVTPRLMALAQAEGPDLLLNLHSHQHPPRLLEPCYVPLEARQEAARLAEGFYALCKDADIEHGPLPKTDGLDEARRPFNMTGALYHAGAACSATVEFPHGLTDGRIAYDYDQILTALHCLFRAAAEFVLGE